MIDPQAKPLLERWIYVQVKVGADFLVPYTPAARERIAREGGYGEPFTAFLDRFLAALADLAWAPGTYYPGGWYRMLTAAGADPTSAQITPAAVARFTQDDFRVDPAGEWWVGEKRIEGPVLRHFLRHLEFDAELERYRVRYWLESYYETRYLHHQSPPLRVARVEWREGAATLHLNDGGAEPLRPDTLRLDGEERLLCAVRPQGLPALFEDNARFELLQNVEERGDARWVLALAGREVPLQLHAPAAFPGGTFAPAIPC